MMSKRFDIATKQLVERQPEAWIRYFNLPGRTVQVIGADLSVLTSEADKVLLVEADEPYVGHIEFQSSYDPNRDWRV